MVKSAPLSGNTLVFEASDEVTRARLRKLEQAGYIGSKPFKTVDGSPNIYFLRELAYNHLDEDYKRVKLPKPFTLAHTLDLITIQIHIEAWFAGMIPLPEPSFGLLILFGVMGLAGLATMKGGA